MDHQDGQGEPTGQTTDALSTGGLTPSPSRRQNGQARSWTIASLGLNIHAGFRGDWLHFLPTEAKKNPKAYPLPSDRAELAIIAGLPFAMPRGQGRRNTTAVYIARARKAMANHRFGTPAKVVEADVVAEACIEHVSKQRDEVDREVRRARLAAERAINSLTDIYGLVKTGERMIVEAFVNNTKVNGEKVSVSQFQASSKTITGHVARLGQGALAPGDKDKAENVVFDEYVAATRKRLAEDEGKALAESEEDGGSVN